MNADKKQRHTLRWTVALAIEIIIGAVSYRFSYIVKWPPQGPVEYFVPLVGVIWFVLGSAAFWAIAGVIHWFLKREPDVTKLELK
jgi:hypothetical protein